MEWTLLHVYFVPDPVEIAPVVDAYRDVLDEVDCVARQPDEWLHATVLMVDGIPTRDVTEQQRADVEQQLRQVLGGLDAFTVTCGPALAGRSSIALDLVPDKDFMELVTLAKTAAGAVFGKAAVQYSGGRPHISLGYATGDGDSGIIQTTLRAATDLRATLTVDAVRLVDTHFDRDLVQFRWEDLAVIPLKR
ncbi:2'-5' RNA ligase family protein [Allokutzneria oryzae]|uniref:2'-5' RNA ligase family protein n=1 Tax=Allokutzneria oryzae TaxID=1378989 RepID=A0ABV6A3V6_9PSEU